MTATPDDDLTLARIYRDDAGGVLAVLIRQFRDFDLAEDALQDALAEALVAWRRDGLPRSTAGWLLTVARRRAIDRIRRALTVRDEANQRELLARIEDDGEEAEEMQPVPDERLRLIFTCCHPALAPDAQVALTLRTICGLTTQQIARAYLTSDVTMAQRLVRAKSKIKLAAIPYEVPGALQLNERLAAVLDVIYLIFNEGFSASDGASPVREELCAEAIRLENILYKLMPHPEAGGLLALMWLHDARRVARAKADGVYVPLDLQDRSLWDREQIARGKQVLLQCLARNRPGPFQIQAAISAVHADAETFAETDWTQIAGLYGALEKKEPSPVVTLNRAVALANAGDVEGGLALLAAIAAALEDYQPLHAARADLLMRCGRSGEAALAYRKAIDLSRNEAERTFLMGKLSQLSN